MRGSWYYVTRLPWRDKDALPPVEFAAADIHVNAIPEATTGTLTYGWVETFEPLDEKTIATYGLIEGSKQK